MTNPFEKIQQHTTVLSVNLNKIALLRNSRGRDFPSVISFAQKTIDLGVKGITVHPRPDERHIRRQDARDLAALISQYDDVELNIEGFPDAAFIQLIEQTKPHQVTLVPDGLHQITSDHGWDLVAHLDELKAACDALRPHAGRIAVFVDPGADLSNLPGICDRVELYTEAYAQAYDRAATAQDFDHNTALADALKPYAQTAAQAQALGLQVNAGHDLDLQNLGRFLNIPGIAEVSIGHALTVEALHFGWSNVVHQYLAICSQSA